MSVHQLPYLLLVYRNRLLRMHQPPKSSGAGAHEWGSWCTLNRLLSVHQLPRSSPALVRRAHSRCRHTSCGKGVVRGACTSTHPKHKRVKQSLGSLFPLRIRNEQVKRAGGMQNHACHNAAQSHKIKDRSLECKGIVMWVHRGEVD